MDFSRKDRLLILINANNFKEFNKYLFIRNLKKFIINKMETIKYCFGIKDSKKKIHLNLDLIGVILILVYFILRGLKLLSKLSSLDNNSNLTLHL
jgi:hypothetical protein